MERTKLNQVVTSERFIMFSKALIEDDYYKKMKPESKLAYSLLRNALIYQFQTNGLILKVTFICIILMRD